MKKAVSPSPLLLLSNTRLLTTLAVFLVMLWGALLLIFHRWPGIDIAFSRLFFERQSCIDDTLTVPVCGFFPMTRAPVYRVARTVLFYLPICCAVFLACASIIALRQRKTPGASEKGCRYALTLLALPVGTGLFINGFLKPFSGRPRPWQTDLFGGRFPFEPAASFAGQCDDNCSFVSGESAMAGWLICLLVALPPKQRAMLAPALVTASLAIPFLRLGFGGHYLSDVVLGWLFSPLVTAMLFAMAATVGSSIKTILSGR